MPAIFTAGIAWAFGMPINTVTQELEVQVEIRNKAGLLIDKFDAIGRSKVNVAAYHGYTKTDAPYMVKASVGRKANIEAYNVAMGEIKTSIERDYEKIQAGLKKINYLHGLLTNFLNNTTIIYNDYKGPLDFILVIKGAIAICVVWFLLAVIGNFISDIVW